MRVHVTMTYGFSADSTVLISQNEVMKIAKDLGYNEIDLFFYDNHNEPIHERSSRYDGIIASVSKGDIVFFQSPSWNGVEWDDGLVNRFIAYGCRIIFFIQDVPPLQFSSNYYLMDAHIRMYNKAELIIVPSQRMYDCLVLHGLTVKKYIIQRMWDFHDSSIACYKPMLKKRLYFTAGNISRFPYILNWKRKTPIHLFSVKEELDYSNVNYGGWLQRTELLIHLSKGGFGLVWGNYEDPKNEKDYYKMNCSYKLATYLSAGIPVVVPNYLSNADFIQKYNLGFVVSNLDEASKVVENCTEEHYTRLINNIQKIQFLINHGYYTKRLFIESILLVNE